MRPVRAKALIVNAFALAGRFAIFNPYTRGAALGYVLLGLSARFVWLLTHPPAQLTIKGSRFYQPEQLLLFVLVGCSGYGEDAITSYIYSFQLLQLQ